MSAQISFDKGVEKIQRGDYEGAIVEFTRTISLSPKTAEAYYNRGIAKKSLNDHRGSIDDNTQAISINPKYWDAYVGRGNSRLGLANAEHTRLAIQDFTKAIENEPSVSAYFNRGVAKYNLKDYKGAILDFEKTLKLNPSHPRALSLLGSAQMCLSY